MKKTCLVTGCAGFIGSHITDRLLNEGCEVIGIDCFTDYYSRHIKENNLADVYKDPHFTLIEKNILDMNSFPDVDFVFHEAAQAGVRASWGDSFITYSRNNIEATQRLLEWYKDSQELKKFVYASSSSVYGNVELPMREDMRLQPLSPYGVSKLAAEHLCYLYWKNYRVPTVSLRYFSVYGPRQRPDMVINNFIQSIVNNKPITIFGDGEQTRDFTHVTDIVNANVLAAVGGISGEVYNIGGGGQITINELVSELQYQYKSDVSIKYAPEQKGDARGNFADNGKAREFLGWVPKVMVRDGLKNICDYQKKL